MIRWFARGLLFFFILLAFPVPSPAPLIYRPGEGWIYVPVGGEDADWRKMRAEDQLQVAREAFDAGNRSLAKRAARRVVNVWPLSDYAPEAQYLMGRIHEEDGKLERAFKAYQRVLERYPKHENYEEILGRQFAIATRYLEGEWFRLWGYIPTGPSRARTAELFEQIIAVGPYSSVAPQSQLNVGNAWISPELGVLPVQKENYEKAVVAFSRAADMYRDQQEIAAEGMFRTGEAYYNRARSADYDQSVADKAIATFSDFITLHPREPRVDEAQRMMDDLRSEQARGNFEIARFYEFRGNRMGALIYYNEVLRKDRNSEYGQRARERIDSLTAQTRRNGS
jgi:outer membrane protein assembly factor BamD (BamD/ComL family)